MRRIILIFAALLTVGVSFAESRGVMVVDSERVFKSIAAYNDALADVERMTKDYESLVDTKFKSVEIYFDEYTQVRQTLTAAQRQQREKMILEKEKEATALQEKYFAKDGAIMKRRLELIAPIQQRVFAAIEEYAKSNGYDVVLDKAANASMLYSSPNSDRTDAIIESLK